MGDEHRETGDHDYRHNNVSTLLSSYETLDIRRLLNQIPAMPFLFIPCRCRCHQHTLNLLGAEATILSYECVNSINADTECPHYSLRLILAASLTKALSSVDYDLPAGCSTGER